MYKMKEDEKMERKIYTRADVHSPEELKKIRKDSGYVQEQIADDIGVTRSCINNYEHGYRHPAQYTIDLIIDAINKRNGHETHVASLPYTTGHEHDTGCGSEVLDDELLS